jgi:hypothetical protein
LKEINIVIVHGFSSLPAEKRLKLLIEKIKEELPQTKLIVPNYLESYGMFAKIFAGRKRIFQHSLSCWRKIKDQIGSGPRIFIGYSLGGLIVRMLIEKFSVEAKAAILVGCPNRGIKFSFWEEMFVNLLNLRCAKEMKEGSAFLESLGYKVEKRYYLIAGENDAIVPVNSALGLEGELIKKISIPGCSHSELIPEKITFRPCAIETIINILKEEVKT